MTVTYGVSVGLRSVEMARSKVSVCGASSVCVKLVTYVLNEHILVNIHPKQLQRPSFPRLG